MQDSDFIDFVDSAGTARTATIAGYIDETFGYQYSFRWPAVVISLCYVLLLRTIVVAATKYIHFDKR
jgi:hypothetical protein